MFKKKNLFLIIFGILFLIFGFAEMKQNTPKAEANVGCGVDCYDDGGVCTYDDVTTTIKFACTINMGGDPDSDNIFGTTECSSGNGVTTKMCKQDKCPVSSEPLLNGRPCQIWDSLPGFIPATCQSPYIIASGKWDASISQCIVCNGNKEDKICGNKNQIITNGSDACIGVGDGNFETACDSGIAADCDDKAEGDICIGGVCDANGQCALSSNLFLNASANPLIIGAGGTSTITFLVTKSGIPINNAKVEDISATGGFVSANFCVTNASGECAVTYTAPAIAGLYGVNAVKATKAGETDSGPAGVVVTVLSSPLVSCGLNTGVLCNPVNNASVFYDVIVIAVRFILSLLALITFLFLIISGIKYLTSFGNEEKMKSAKDGLTSAVFGLALVLMAYVILEAIITILNS